MAKKLGPLAQVQAQNRAKAERSARRANVSDERFAYIAKGFAPAPDPMSLAQIQGAGDRAKVELEVRMRSRIGEQGTTGTPTR